MFLLLSKMYMLLMNPSNSSTTAEVNRFGMVISWGFVM